MCVREIETKNQQNIQYSADLIVAYNCSSELTETAYCTRTHMFGNQIIHLRYVPAFQAFQWDQLRRIRLCNQQDPEMMQPNDDICG